MRQADRQCLVGRDAASSPLGTVETRVGPLVARRLLAAESALPQANGLVMPPLLPQAQGQVVVAFCRVGVVFAQRLLADQQGLPVQRQRLGVLALIVQAGCHVVV